MSLKVNIKKFLTSNETFLRDRMRYAHLSKLTPDSSADLFQRYKDRSKVLDKEYKTIGRVNLYSKCDEYNDWSGRNKNLKNITTKSMEEFLRSKERPADRFNENNLKNFHENKIRERVKERTGIKGKNKNVTGNKVFKNRLENILSRNVINFEQPQERSMFGNVIKGLLYKTDYDHEDDIKVGMKNIYAEQDEKKNTINRTECTEDNVPFMSKLIKGRIDDAISRLTPTERNAGYNIYCLIKFQGTMVGTENVTHMNCKKLTGNNDNYISIGDIENTISTSGPLYKNARTDDYKMFLSEVKILISKRSRSGGCDTREHNEILKKEEKYSIKSYSYKSKHDNCLIMIFSAVFEINGNVFKSDRVRQKCNIKSDGMIDKDKIEDILHVYNEHPKNKNKKDWKYILVDGHFNIIQSNLLIECENLNDQVEFLDDDTIIIQLKNNHYTHLVVTKNPWCDECKQPKYKDHKCDNRRVNYINHVEDKTKDTLRIFKNNTEDLIDEDKLIFFDIICKIVNGRKVVDRCGYLLGEYYYEDDFQGAVETFLEQKDKILIAYGGSDNHFILLINEVEKLGGKISDMLGTSRILKLKINDSVTVFDTKNFTDSSLKKCCQSFGIKLDEDDLEGNPQGSLESRIYASKKIFHGVNKTLHEISKKNITGFCTLAQCSYWIWNNMLPHTEDKHLKNIHIPKDKDNYDFIRKSIYGGRTNILKKEFKSDSYQNILDGKVGYDELLNSGDYLVDADTCSLYPSSMVNNDFMKVKYPIGRGRWSKDPEKDFKNGLLGFYQVKYCCNKKLRVPILPRKENNRLLWDLIDSEGVYCSVDIENAIDYSYKIEFLEKAYVYDNSTDKLFSKFVDKFFQIKSENYNNKVKYQFAKNILNSLYGKLIQKIWNIKVEMIDTLDNFYKFANEFEISDWDFSDKSIILSGIDTKSEFKNSKPIHLGSFVLGYSRRLMLIHMKNICDLNEIPFIYTDTDSLFITGKHHKMLLKKGLFIEDKRYAKLGYLCNDLDGNAIIFRQLNLSTKQYTFSSIDEKEQIEDTSKCRGINEKYINQDMYDDDEGVLVKFKTEKKIFDRRTKKQIEDKVEKYSILEDEIKRTFNVKIWDGMQHKNGQFYPYGFEGSK